MQKKIALMALFLTQQAQALIPFRRYHNIANHNSEASNEALAVVVTACLLTFCVGVCACIINDAVKKKLGSCTNTLKNCYGKFAENNNRTASPTREIEGPLIVRTQA